MVLILLILMDNSVILFIVIIIIIIIVIIIIIIIIITGNVYYNLEQYTDAINAYATSIEIKPTEVASYINLGYHHYHHHCYYYHHHCYYYHHHHHYYYYYYYYRKCVQIITRFWKCESLLFKGVKYAIIIIIIINSIISIIY